MFCIPHLNCASMNSPSDHLKGLWITRKHLSKGTSISIYSMHTTTVETPIAVTLVVPSMNIVTSIAVPLVPAILVERERDDSMRLID